MRLGELAEPVQKRSVFRQLNMDECVGTAFATVSEVPGFEGLMEPLVTEAANRLFASGFVPQSLAVYGLLPPSCEECGLQADMKQLAAAARQYSIEVTDARAEVTTAVVRPQYIVTVHGTEDCGCRRAGGQDAQADDNGGLACQDGDSFVQREGQIYRHAASKVSRDRGDGSVQRDDPAALHPGDDLVLTKWIALGGTAALARVFGDELRSRYPYSLIDRAKEFEKLMSVETEARAVTHFGPCAMHSLSEGGIFNALWRMAECAGVGLEVDLKKIPVKQETIEICEYFDINPYYLYSAGALLIGAGNGQALVSELERAGVPAAVIGRATEGKRRVIRNGGEERFLDRPQQEEWYRRAAGMVRIAGK